MIELIRKRSRRLIAYALYYSGVLWLLAAIRFRGRAIVLTYHRVLPEDADTFSADGVIVRPETFARQMAFLRRHFRLLSVEDLERRLAERKPLPSRSCLVTFDDGWADNHQYALPILRQHNVPAVIFVAADFIGSEDCFWQERITRLLYTAAVADGEARAVAEGELGRDIRDEPRAEQRRIVREAVDRLKRRSLEQVQELERALASKLGPRSNAARGASGEDRFMDWRQVAELIQDSAVAVGAHGCSHAPLTSMDVARASAELNESRARVGAVVGRPILSVAYPNGDFNESVVALSRAAGFKLGFTTDKGSVGSEADPLKLPRINIHESATRTMPEFLCALLLVFQRLRRAPI